MFAKRMGQLVASGMMLLSSYVAADPVMSVTLSIPEIRSTEAPLSWQLDDQGQLSISIPSYYKASGRYLRQVPAPLQSSLEHAFTAQAVSSLELLATGSNMQLDAQPDSVRQLTVRSDESFYVLTLNIDSELGPLTRTVRLPYTLVHKSVSGQNQLLDIVRKLVSEWREYEDLVHL